MGVLESPITWIVVAAVLVVIAVVLLVLSAVRRRRARRAAAAAAAWPPPALEAGRVDPDAPWTGPTPEVARERVGVRTPVSNLSGRADAAAATRYAEPDTSPIDVDTIRARLAAEPARADPPTSDGDPGATEAAKDRLLGVLLRDPQAAISAVSAITALTAAGTGRPGEGHGDVTALLRAGLSPAQVARLVGVDERALATVVARGLGLLPADQASGGGVATGENRTDDPGRSCANTASSAGSTTPTTG